MRKAVREYLDKRELETQGVSQQGGSAEKANVRIADRRSDPCHDSRPVPSHYIRQTPASDDRHADYIRKRQLSPTRQRVLNWFLDGEPIEQIELAKQIGCSPSLISKHLQAIKRDLKQQKKNQSPLARGNTPVELVMTGDSHLLRNYEVVAEKLVEMAKNGNLKAIEIMNSVVDKYRPAEPAKPTSTTPVHLDKGIVLFNLKMQQMGKHDLAEQERRDQLASALKDGTITPEEAMKQLQTEQEASIPKIINGEVYGSSSEEDH